MNDNCSAFDSDDYEIKIKQTLPYYEEFYRQVIDVVRASFSNALKWLDVGCGTGKMAAEALKELDIDSFTFCDCSAEMIKAAQSRFNFTKADFIISPLQELNFDSSFDVVTAIQVNHYLKKEERITAVYKCFKALKTGGMFISFENFAPYSRLGEKIYLDRWQAFQLRQGKNKAECEKHRERYNKNYYPITISEHLNIMKNCGFQAVEILWLSCMQVGILGIK